MPTDHFKEAEKALDRSKQPAPDRAKERDIARAHVHALLAAIQQREKE